ncbi:hypothetical protein AB832_07900 [Flavobacteriaceae bacterium (ex Bugula neritina AB1)]|nr:hypothetical protein AB832_07900 [Flavobacteriaceae bacterium (ex Bugula neritina AB1)]
MKNKERIQQLEDQQKDTTAMIETLQKLVEAQDGTIDELRKSVESYANEAERANNRINELEATLIARFAIGNAIAKTKETIKVSEKVDFPLGGMVTKVGEIHEREIILTNEQVSKLGKPESEKQEPEQEAFKVGDKVRIKLKDHRCPFPWIVKDVKNEVVFTIGMKYEDGTYSLKKNGKWYKRSDISTIVCFEREDLQLVKEEKKELKFGAWAEVVKDTNEFPSGTVVLVGFYTGDEELICLSEYLSQYGHVQMSNLKPL